MLAAADVERARVVLAELVAVPARVALGLALARALAPFPISRFALLSIFRVY